MFRVKKIDKKVASTNYVSISIDVILVTFFVNFGHRFLVFLFLTLNK